MKRPVSVEPLTGRFFARWSGGLASEVELSDMALGAHLEASLRQPTGEASEQQHAIVRWAASVGLRPFHAWARLALPWTLVTDDGADAARVQKFRDAGVQVEVASPSG